MSCIGPVITRSPVKVPGLDEKIGQMIMVGIDERKSLPAGDTLRRELKSGKIGGIILFEKNISENSSYSTLKEFIKDLRSGCAVAPFMAIDEEGGRVHRLKEKYGFVAMPSAAYLGSLNEVDSTYYYASRLAGQLHNLGFNINFAPVVDVSLNPENTVIVKAGRSYSDDPEIVSLHAKAFIKAHHNEKVATSLKHFPGHGSSTADTHKGLVNVTNQWQFKELVSYKKIFETGVYDAVISCHVVNCRLDTSCVPLTLSKTATSVILREVLGFKGVVFSDDMQMYAISQNYSLEQSIKMAINAGVDVLVFGNNVNLTDRISATKIHSIIKTLVEKGDISQVRIDESYQRVVALKNKYVKKARRRK